MISSTSSLLLNRLSWLAMCVALSRSRMPVRTLACIVHSVFTCVGKWYMHHGVKHMGWFSAGHMSNTCTGNGIPWSINHNNVQPQDIL